MLNHLPRPDGLAQGPLRRLFKRCPRDAPAGAVSSQPEQVRSRELGDLQDALHVARLPVGGAPRQKRYRQADKLKETANSTLYPLMTS